MENHSEMLLQFLDRLYSSPATNDTDRWLLWQLESTNQNEDGVDNVFPQVGDLSGAGDGCDGLQVLVNVLTVCEFVDRETNTYLSISYSCFCGHSVNLLCLRFVLSNVRHKQLYQQGGCMQCVYVLKSIGLS